jgi:uncharacterized phage protein (TIGR01671 family)
MREIKFRAWDENRKMFYTSPKWVEFQVNLNGTLTAKNYSMPHQKGYQQLEIVQYTGENTKEGEDVWEGDIFKQTMGDRVVIFEVIFKYSMFMARIKHGREFALMVALQNNYNHECKLEKLGNIYENPELLEQK